MQLTTTGDFVDICRIGLFNTHGHIGTDLFEQTVTDLTGGDKLAFSTGQRRVVNVQFHGKRRLIHLNHRQCNRIFPISNGFANVNGFDAGYGNNVAGLCGFDFDSMQTHKAKDFADLEF